MKSTFNGLQFCCTHYRTIFIRLTMLPPKHQNREIMQNSDKI